MCSTWLLDLCKRVRMHTTPCLRRISLKDAKTAWTPSDARLPSDLSNALCEQVPLGPV